MSFAVFCDNAPLVRTVRCLTVANTLSIGLPVRTGARWADVPERYGPPTTIYTRFNRWRKAGVWDRLMDAITEAYDGDVQMIDTSVVRVHQQGGTAKRGIEIDVWVVSGAD